MNLFIECYRNALYFIHAGLEEGKVIKGKNVINISNINNCAFKCKTESIMHLFLVFSAIKYSLHKYLNEKIHLMITSVLSMVFLECIARHREAFQYIFIMLL